MTMFTSRITVVFASLFLMVVSCESILNNSNKKQQIEIQIKEDKKEANLLVNTTQNNLNTISLCEIIEKSQSDTVIKETVQIIRKSQEQMFADFQEVASENLVSVASRSNIVLSKGIDSLVHNGNPNIVLSKIDRNMNLQIQVLDTLIEQGNRDLQILAKAYKKVVAQDDLYLDQVIEQLK